LASFVLVEAFPVIPVTARVEALKRAQNRGIFLEAPCEICIALECLFAANLYEKESRGFGGGSSLDPL